ncbi:MAG: NADH-quinone oxidoreductase subunit J [Candidatus Thalassarchaeaceae archaeon]|nr:NADH-quinone oxidoreductase subunit J [Candidatus Thalassarchaeaceae archaeon]
MRAISALTSVGTFIFVLLVLQEVNSHSMWGVSGNPPSTVEFANSIFNEWAIVTIILGALLAMAMIGASYLVRDERLINLVWDIKGDISDNIEKTQNKKNFSNDNSFGSMKSNIREEE